MVQIMKNGGDPCNHPLSIEAIFSTFCDNCCEIQESEGNHPLSIEAIFSTVDLSTEKDYLVL